jgi:hypothetical protein
MSSKSKTSTSNTTNGTTNVTQTPTNPAFVQPAIQGLAGQITNLSAQDPYSFVAGPDPLQTQAGAGAGALTTPQGFADAQSALKGAAGAQGQSLLSGLQNYMSPYTNDVVDTTLAGFDKNAGYTRAADTLAKAGDATFGGSGGAIQTALNEQNIAQGRAQTEAQLRDQAFQTGAGLSNEDAARRQEAISQQIAAAQGLSGNATAQAAADQGRVQTQSQIGQMLQQLAQAHATAPLATTGALTSMLGGLPLGLLHGQDTNGVENSTSNGTSTTSTSNPLGTIGSLVSAGGSLASGLGAMGLMFSDRRLKTEIKRVGELDDGLGVFSYRYKAGGPKQIGVMAQEVAKVKPEAVHNIGGLLAVDYGQL